MHRFRFALYRPLQLIPVLFGIGLITFVLVRSIPGDPARLQQLAARLIDDNQIGYARRVLETTLESAGSAPVRPQPANAINSTMPGQPAGARRKRDGQAPPAPRELNSEIMAVRHSAPVPLNQHSPPLARMGWLSELRLISQTRRIACRPAPCMFGHVSPDYSVAHTNPKRQRGGEVRLPR